MFALTACSFAVMHLKQLQATSVRQASSTQDPWLTLLDRYGGRMLAVALAMLAIAALADVAWDYTFGKTRTKGHESSRGSSEQGKGGNGE